MPLASNKTLPLWLVHSLMLCTAMIVSSSFTVGEAITRALDPAVLLLLRYLVAVFCLAPLILWRYRHCRPSFRQLAG
jgi:membrane protein YdbS with pleckstrin-like domain